MILQVNGHNSRCECSRVRVPETVSFLSLCLPNCLHYSSCVCVFNNLMSSLEVFPCCSPAGLFCILSRVAESKAVTWQEELHSHVLTGRGAGAAYHILSGWGTVRVKCIGTVSANHVVGVAGAFRRIISFNNPVVLEAGVIRSVLLMR